MKSEVFNHLLSKLDIHPVLIDIGASDAPPKIWDRIARHAIYVGFDPDLRELHQVSDGRFYRAITVNEAITDDEQSNETLFYFTRSPYCSSTLKPDLNSLSNYIFHDLFFIEREEKIRATSLGAVMDLLALPCIDWLKTDSQGTDLRIFNSLRDKVRSRVLALDIEPGLIDAYIGEDLFVDAHRELTRNGFWLSNLNVGGTARMRRSTLREIMALNTDISYELVDKTVKKSPVWCEARYFRTIEWLAQGDFTKRDYVLLWTFALLDGQLGFAIDLGIECERVFGKDDVSRAMKEESILRIRRSRHKVRLAKSLPFRIMRRLYRNFDTNLS